MVTPLVSSPRLLGGILPEGHEEVIEYRLYNGVEATWRRSFTARSYYGSGDSSRVLLGGNIDRCLPEASLAGPTLVRRRVVLGIG